MTDDKATQELPAIDAKPARERKVSKRLAEVVRLLASGECKTQRAAAKRVGLNPGDLSEALRKPHVQGFIERTMRQNLANGALRASNRLVDLLDASSEHVQFDASKHLLGIAGIKPADHAQQVNVNVEIKAGYVIDLTDKPDEARTIDVSLQPRPALPGSARTIERKLADPTIFKKPGGW
jgi:hypothetical protein